MGVTAGNFAEMYNILVFYLEQRRMVIVDRMNVPEPKLYLKV